MKYKIYYLNKSKIKTKAIQSFNISSLKYKNDLPKNIIKIQKIKNYTLNIFNNNDDIINLIYELKTLLNSHLTFLNAIDILLKTEQKQSNINILKSIKYSLENGHLIYKDLQQHDNIPYSVILFFKIGQKNINMKNSINSLYEILIQNNNIKTQLKKVLTYPFILVLSLFISMYVIFAFVLDKFEYIYSSFGSNLPYSTKILLDIKYFLFEYYYIFFTFLIIIYILIKYLYKKYQIYFDKILLNNIPIFSTMYKNLLIYRLFLSLHLIVKSNNTFLLSLKNSKYIIKNKYLFLALNKIQNDINNGVNISDAFLNTNIFPSSLISLLNIAQKTNNMEYLLDDIKNIQKNKVNKSLKNFKTFLEPILVFLISSIILYLVIAILSPIWDLNSVIN